MHILLGVDGNDLSLQALTETVERARTAGDKVTVAVYSDSEGRPLSEIQTRTREHLDDIGFDAPIRAVEGDPGSRLVTLAEEEGFDCIALPGGQRSPLGKIKLDPISEFVLLNAPTTVTLVR